MSAPVGWLLHDPDSRTVTVDLPGAVSDGAVVLRVSYDEERNSINVTVSREATDAERMS